MKKIVTLFLLLLSTVGFSQSVQMDLFVKSFTPSTSQVGLRVRSTGGTIPFQGATFYVLYQSTNAGIASYDDTKLVTTYGWGTGSRSTNPALALNTTKGGRTYDRRFVYLNSDDFIGANTVNLTATWDTLLYITFNNLQATSPQGGHVYAEETTEALGVALTDLEFNNIPIDVVSSAVALAPGALPVRLTKFDAQCLPNKTSLVSWSTAEEINSSHYEVEKSENGIEWKSVGRVNSSGNSSSPRNYEYSDLGGGPAQYRLKQVDIDGKVTYSSIARTSCDSRNVYVNLYPVPARDFVNLVVGANRAVKTNIQVFDNKGKLVINMPVTLTSGQNSFRINVHHLATGEYYLRSTDSGIEINKKFTVVR